MNEHIGFNLERYQELGGVFVMRRIEIEYLRSAVAGETLEVTTWLHEMRGPRAIRHYEIRKQEEDQLLVALWVWVEMMTMRPKAIPTQVMEAFGQLRQTQIATGS